MGEEVPFDRRTAVGIVLAAGASRRNQWGPKALLEVDGRPAVATLVATLRSAGLRRIRVVLGAHRASIRSALDGESVELVENDDWERGRTGSVQRGLADAGDVSGAVLAPVDHPWVRPGTVDALLRRAESDRMALWVDPAYRDRSGHPTVIKRAVFPQIAALPSEEPLHAVARRLGVGRCRVPTEDEGVVLSSDTVAEYASARRRLGAGPEAP